MGKKGKGKKGKGDAVKAESNIPSWEPPARKEIPPPPPPRRSDLPKDVHAAAASGDRERVNAWLGEAEYGHVDATCSEKSVSGRTLLMSAAAGGQVGIVSTLTYHGADIDKQDSNGDTALMLASMQCLRGYGSHDGQDACIRYLLQRGARRDLMNKDGKTAEEVVGDGKHYLLENQGAVVAVYEGNPIYVELPANVVLEITYTEPGLQGDRSSGGTKPATLETGLQIQVPLFIEQNVKVRVDTRTGEYLGRVTD